MSIIQIIYSADIVVKAIMLILLFCSVLSWGIIINKINSITKIGLISNNFIKTFDKTDNITDLYNKINKKTNNHGVIAIFQNGINEFNELKKININDRLLIHENIERILNNTIEVEVNYYKNRLSILATLGSVSPYIGLLGTVWGIMHSFINLSNSNTQATLSLVAPGIAEALIATVMGLLVAIPAYIFYNKFLSDIYNLNIIMNKFTDNFLNLINRSLMIK